MRRKRKRTRQAFERTSLTRDRPFPIIATARTLRTSARLLHGGEAATFASQMHCRICYNRTIHAAPRGEPLWGLAWRAARLRHMLRHRRLDGRLRARALAFGRLEDEWLGAAARTHWEVPVVASRTALVDAFLVVDVVVAVLPAVRPGPWNRQASTCERERAYALRVAHGAAVRECWGGNRSARGWTHS